MDLDVHRLYLKSETILKRNLWLVFLIFFYLSVGLESTLAKIFEMEEYFLNDNPLIAKFTSSFNELCQREGFVNRFP